MMSAFAFVIVILLCAALVLAAQAGVFGVHAHTLTRRLLRGRRARGREREMVEAMRAKLAAAAAGEERARRRP